MRPLITASSIGWVYLWHFSKPLGNLANTRAQAQHYCGFSNDPDGDGAELERRAAEHLAGRGAKITRAALANGIEITLVSAWRAPLAFEKQIKRRKEAPRLCPVCCRKHGRKVKRVTVATQLELPLFEIEPWPVGFEFPAPALSRPSWAEMYHERTQRAAAVALSASDDWDDGLL